ncbi:porin family protein [Confluentibacter sediminis]|uniref:porin family protein n=1 Tax=Confluentibacter sediminis TaxID=2219045 RepID=UPI000DAB594B|nr:porin family protein [Confluentibacter sediminis]
MNKTIFFLLIFCPEILFSQAEFGVIGGINNSRLTNGFLKDFETESSFGGLHLGAFMELNISDKISFYPKILYSQQGDRKKTETQSRFNAPTQIDYKLDYINVPLNIKFFSKPYLFVGPQIGFLINTKKENMDLGDVDSFDFGINLGIGYEFNYFSIETNIYQGANTLIEVDDATLPNPINRKLTNAVIQISLKYKI